MVAHVERVRTDLSQPSGVRWVPPASLHCTLKFLGPVPEESIPTLEEVCHQIANRCSEFDSRVAELEWVPSRRRPRLVWMRLEPVQRFEELAKTLDEALEILGHPRETRPFRPHLTLGRVSCAESLRPTRGFFTGANSAEVPWRVSAFTLYRSEPGSRYISLAEFRLLPEAGCRLSATDFNRSDVKGS